jgi:hypothetical protein
VFLLMALASPALALDLNVAWTPSTPGQINGGSDPIAAYQLFECTLATCPAPSTSATAWAKVADLAAGVPVCNAAANECAAKFTRADPPAGGKLTLSYFMVAKSTSGSLSSASNVIVTTAAGNPTPPSAPGNLRITNVPLVIGPQGGVRVSSNFPNLTPRETIQGCYVKRDGRS